MNSISIFMFATLFSITYAFAAEDFSACAGRYRVIEENSSTRIGSTTPTIQEIVIESTQVLKIKDNSVHQSLQLKVYSWTEEGYFGFAGFENKQNVCLWYQSHNAGGKSFEITIGPDGSAEAVESCSWRWTCQYEIKYKLERINSQQEPIRGDSCNQRSKGSPGTWD